MTNPFNPPSWTPRIEKATIYCQSNFLEDDHARIPTDLDSFGNSVYTQLWAYAIDYMYLPTVCEIYFGDRSVIVRWRVRRFDKEVGGYFRSTLKGRFAQRFGNHVKKQMALIAPSQFPE